MASWKDERKTNRKTIKCCFGCVPPKRYPGCHGKCEEYKKEKAEYKKQMEEYKKNMPKMLSNHDFNKL